MTDYKQTVVVEVALVDWHRLDYYKSADELAERDNRLMAWLSDPANRSDINYSDIYKDVFGVRPRQEKRKGESPLFFYLIYFNALKCEPALNHPSIYSKEKDASAL